jgi:glycosyltransferase involved in cell wall biosynthesis
VVTLHDLGLVTHPAYFGAAYPSLFKAHLRDLVRRRATVISVSRYTADQLRARVPGAQRLDVHVIAEGVAAVFLEPPDESAARERLARFELERPYFLCAGSVNPRKNLLKMLDAYESLVDVLPHDLVIAGAPGWDDERIWARLRRARAAGRVRFAGFVDDPELAALYRLADGLLFVSLFEGFGLPAAEAMSCGCPVIASNVTSLPEVVGDAGLLIDPTDTPALANALRRVGLDSSLRAEMAARGRERARRFRWSEAARATHALYRDVLERA